MTLVGAGIAISAPTPRLRPQSAIERLSHASENSGGRGLAPGRACSPSQNAPLHPQIRSRSRIGTGRNR